MLGNTTSITLTDAPSPAAFRLSPAPRRSPRKAGPSWICNPRFWTVGAFLKVGHVRFWPFSPLFKWGDKTGQNRTKSDKIGQNRTFRPFFHMAQTCLSSASLRLFAFSAPLRLAPNFNFPNFCFQLFCFKIHVYPCASVVKKNRVHSCNSLKKSLSAFQFVSLSAFCLFRIRFDPCSSLVGKAWPPKPPAAA